MAGKKFIFPFLFFILTSQVQSASLIEKSYEYVINFGKSIAPNLMSIWECIGQEEAWSCAREKAGKMLDGWDEQVENERRSWQDAADAEVAASGRSLKELPSKLGQEVESSLSSLVEVVHHGIARALQSRKHSEGGIDSITISTGSGDKKKKMKKKKTKPPKIHLLHPVMMPMRKAEEKKGRSFPNGRQSWVIGQPGSFNVEGVQKGDVANDDDDTVDLSELEGVHRVQRGLDSDTEVDVNGVRRVDGDNVDISESEEVHIQPVESGSEGVDVNGVHRGVGRGVMADLWSMSEEALDVMADAALEAENKDNGVQDKSTFQEQRGKKKKKKKAILKLLILGAVLKAKIGTLFQILSFKLQVKFFIVAVLGLAINLARLWIDLKNKHQQQPQKVIYYEHAQHQHHYDHEDEHESHGWGPWSRSMEPEETDVEVDVDFQNNAPYRGQERISHPRAYIRHVSA